MRTKRLLFFYFTLLFAGLACGTSPSEPVAIPIEQTETPDPYVGINVFDHGELKILYENPTISTANESWMKPSYGCWPTSHYDDGGGYLRLVEGETAGTRDVLGFCSWTSPSDSDPSVTWNSTGNLQGTVAAGRFKWVEFEFNTQADYFTHVIDIKFGGNGDLKGSHAEGSAAFVANCRSNGSEANCESMTAAGETISRSSWTIRGTVYWTMDFTP